MKLKTQIPGKDIYLEKIVTDFSLLVKQLCPDARIKISTTPFEDEDATINVSPPDNWTYEQSSDLEEKLAEESVDTLLETGYCVLVGVLEPSQSF